MLPALPPVGAAQQNPSLSQAIASLAGRARPDNPLLNALSAMQQQRNVDVTMPGFHPGAGAGLHPLSGGIGDVPHVGPGALNAPLAPALAAGGDPSGAANLWISRHPGALRAAVQGQPAHIPGFVGEGLAQQFHGMSNQNLLQQIARSKGIAQALQHLRKLRPAGPGLSSHQAPPAGY